ncbi:hypothetical protein DFJ77DRAFT_252222 [Powellomyces hirtus]|nr:hypothetical protein DFJ77DRAFT_252222 [Powellomyces hirtus]
MVESRPTTEFVLSMIPFTLAVIIGLSNGYYVGRQDLIKYRGKRGYTTACSQAVMLVSYVSSLLGGLAYCKGDMPTYNASYHLSGGTFILGSFLVVFVLLAFLPAVQVCMSYNPRWNTAIKITTVGMFGIAIVGFLTTTGMVGHKQVNMEDAKDLDDLVSLRSLFFTAWAAYAPFIASVISILVIRMVIAVKHTLAGARTSLTELSTNAAPSSVQAALHSIQRRAVLSTCFAIPITLLVGSATLFPYSVIVDAISTLYASCFCTWILYNMYVIRLVVTYRDRPANTNRSQRVLRAFPSFRPSTNSKFGSTTSLGGSTKPATQSYKLSTRSKAGGSTTSLGNSKIDTIKGSGAEDSVAAIAHKETLF